MKTSNPTLVWVAAELQAARLSSNKGTDFPDGLEFVELLFVLTQQTNRGQFSDDDERRICANALKACARHPKSITGAVLVAELRAARGVVMRLPEQRFVLYSSVSVPVLTKLAGARFGETRVSFHKRFPAHYDRSFIKDVAHWNAPPSDDRLLKARVAVTARTPSTAFRDAMAKLDLLRALWNLAINRTRLREWNADETEPLNRVLPGPLHTLHIPSGKPAVKEYWYDPFYRPSHHVWSPAKVVKYQSDVQYLRRLVSACPYPEAMENVLVRYCRALDVRDPQFAFLKLWGVLEELTCTQQQSYETTINRLLFLYADQRFHRSVLYGLRDYRNQTVHHGLDRMDRENLFRLHRYVVELILFVLKSRTKFASLTELGSFLASPTDPIELERLVQRYKMAKAFRQTP